MKAWVAKKVEGGFTVNAIDDEGTVCRFLGNDRPHIVQKEEADALVEKCNMQEIESLVRQHKERAAQLAAYEEIGDSTYTPVEFSE